MQPSTHFEMPVLGGIIGKQVSAICPAPQSRMLRMCGYCIMSNHWHLVLWPKADGDLSEFMRWVTQTHSQRWHAAHGTVGIGHLYQGRFKSFPVQSNAYYLTLMRYVESNPLRASLVEKASQWHRMVNNLTTIDEGIVNRIERSIDRGSLLGDNDWMMTVAGELGLESTIRPKGRPRKES